MTDWMILLGFGLAALAASMTGAMFRPGDWYRALAKPTWTPPNWLFPVAWLVIYVAMVFAGWRLAISGHPLVPLALAFWAAQIAFNAVWSPVFFGLHRLGAALVVIAGLWATVAVTLVVAAMIDIWAALLLVPYIVWVSYAVALNAKVLRMNPRLKTR